MPKADVIAETNGKFQAFPTVVAALLTASAPTAPAASTDAANTSGAGFAEEIKTKYGLTTPGAAEAYASLVQDPNLVQSVTLLRVWVNTNFPYMYSGIDCLDSQVEALAHSSRALEAAIVASKIHGQ